MEGGGGGVGEPRKNLGEGRGGGMRATGRRGGRGDSERHGEEGRRVTEEEEVTVRGMERMGASTSGHAYSGEPATPSIPSLALESTA